MHHMHHMHHMHLGLVSLLARYLSKFKWDHLTEEIAYERAVREQKLLAEMSVARRERDAYLAQVTCCCCCCRTACCLTACCLTACCRTACCRTACWLCSWR
jgi:hypothetical protein